MAWLNRTQIRERMDDAYAVRMLDALAEGPPAVRTHDGVQVIASSAQA